MPLGLGNIHNAQTFLQDRINDIKNLGTPEGYADALIGGSAILGSAPAAPVKIVDMVDRNLGGGGVREGFVKGTTKTGDVITPVLPF